MVERRVWATRGTGQISYVLWNVIGGGIVSWKVLQDVILDVEVTLYNWPLDYVEDNAQHPIRCFLGNQILSYN
jgi:hypothetical protein